jgi:hypothetical protein
MKFCLFGQNSQHLDPWQRLYGFFYPFLTCTASFGVLEMVSNMILFAAGWPNAIFADMEQLKLLVRVAAIGWLLRYARLCQVALLSGYSATFREMCCLYFLNPCKCHCFQVSLFTLWSILTCWGADFAYDHCKTFLLPKWLGGRPEAFTAKFVATGSIVDELNERNRHLRAPVHRRVKSVLFQDGAIFHLLIAIVYIVALALNLRRAYSLYPDDTRGFRLYLLTRIFWVPPMWPYYIATFLKPLWYSLSPPSMPDREKLLIRDEAGLAYPTEDAKRPKYTGQGFGLETLDTLAVTYAAGILASTWYW